MSFCREPMFANGTLYFSSFFFKIWLPVPRANRSCLSLVTGQKKNGQLLVSGVSSLKVQESRQHLLDKWNTENNLWSIEH